MQKVNAHGIQGDATRWIRNWLAGHRQRVCINQSYSNWTLVTSGVPQGSVLGPLLFLIYIYINDLDTNIVSKTWKFADDTKLCRTARNADDIMELQEDINNLVEWANKWQMSFNVDKSSVMQIVHKNMQSNCNISNQQLPTTDQQQDMGIIVTEDLKWQKQTEKRCKTVNRALGFIARNCRYKTKELILPLYKSLVRPHLEHVVQFRSPHFRRDNDKIENMQRRATKMISEIRNHSYYQQLQDLDLIGLVQRRLRGQLIEAFKYLNRFTTASA